MNQRHCYEFSIADLASAKGELAGLAFDGAGPNHLAAALQEALRYPGFHQQWVQLTGASEAEAVALGLTDDQALTKARLADLAVDLEVVTTLPMRIVRHRLSLLIGEHWQLRDVRNA
ncbi:hypothetical protein [Frateuria aurantia]|uniref:Uncharacterized protein n=1 Tax=Frateuria aurantia (strain ATCC 33424 / DSM 6220 / KCTC 2777 / LMG 1558 / NBRC 3245 / NCIMB 13370) TaxID=767434 RepID=H8KZC6_FRAAD|nr:hypothetical protein [Frateuria aurantia]AFC85232.1 hypothetical protein Fraau_0761 [Frateuria aurantia DSM 6220]